MVIHKRVFTPLQDISTCIIQAVNQTSNSTMAVTENLMPRCKIFCKYHVVEFEERLTASIIRVERSQRDVKTLLWITKNYKIDYEKLC